MKINEFGTGTITGDTATGMMMKDDIVTGRDTGPDATGEVFGDGIIDLERVSFKCTVAEDEERILNKPIRAPFCFV
jgi:hypothetical protein